MRYYIIAGEKSGDLHAGKLIQELQTFDQEMVCRGVGGGYMQRAGVHLMAHYNELAFIGFNIVKILSTLRKHLSFCKKDILAFKPDAVILVDYGGFNLRIAKFAKAYSLKVFYYIPPKVWAWHTSRIRQLQAYVDWIYVILPFEKAFYTKYNIAHVTYVGHPSLEDTASYIQQNKFLHPGGSTSTCIALLPGSRPQEIKKILPTMLAIVPQLADFKFVVAAVSELSAALYEQASNTPGVEIVYDQTYDLLSQASIAIVASGTATLEAAFLQIPQIVVYKTDLLTYWLAKHCLKIKNIALINILAQKRIVPELIQYQFTAKNLLQALEKMIYSGHVRKQQISNYKRIINSFGKQKASISTAKHIFTYMHPSGYTQDISKVQ